MKPKYYLITLCAIITLFTTCKEPELETIYMTEELKSYILFPVDSYWIYEDSISGDIDTVYLEGQTIKIIKDEDRNINIETLFNHYDTKHFNSLGSTSIEAIFKYDSDNKKIYKELLGYNWKATFFCNIDTGWHISSNSRYSKNYLTYKLGEFVFQDVKEYKTNDNIYFIYWAKNVDLIKYSTLDRNWILKKYYINN